MSFKFKFADKSRALPKYLINIGACLDIPTATFVNGIKGETIISGGLGQIVGIVGAGNNFKSTLIHYFMLSAADKLFQGSGTQMMTYDSELNTVPDRLETLASNFKNIPESPIYTGHWYIIQKSPDDPPNKWLKDLNDYMDEKTKDKKSYMKCECFKNPYEPNKLLEIPVPTFVEIDSFTEFNPESVDEILSEDADSKETNTWGMKMGNFKTKIMASLAGKAATSNTHILLTAHTGGSVDMNTKPWEQESKKLQHLKSGDSIKGVGSKFTFLTNQAYQAHTGSAFYNQNTKGPEYPKDAFDNSKAELNKVSLTLLRNKNGVSGGTIELLIAQKDGVLPTLTEFHHLRTNKKSGTNGGWGMIDEGRGYKLAIYPNVVMSRTTIRKLIDEDSKLRRAMNITSELLQLYTYHSGYLRDNDLLLEPEEIYSKMIELGYNWDEILETRGYWLPNQYSHPVKFLSTIDILKICRGKYTPYWKDKK